MEPFKKLIHELYSPDLSVEVLNYIFMVAHKMDGNIEAIVGRHGITRTQFNVLNILSRQFPESLNMKQIKERSVLANSDISRVIGRMLRSGLVDCEINPKNKRSTNVSLTTKGRELFIEITKNRDEAMLPFDSFPKEEMEQAKKWLTKLLTEIEK